MRKPKLEEIVAALLSIGALGVVGWIAIVTQSEMAMGALISILAGAVSFYLRGRVVESNNS